MSSPFEQLQQWFQEQCDGDWEHSYGISIDTLDNPGWQLVIDLTDTALENKPFEENSFNAGKNYTHDAESWYLCRVKDGQFDAAGSSEMLEKLITIFIEWAYSPNT